MSEWYDNQRKPSLNVADWMEAKRKEQKERTLTKEQQKRLAKLEGMLQQLKCGGKHTKSLA